MLSDQGRTGMKRSIIHDPPDTIRAFIYCRRSREGGRSVERQEQDGLRGHSGTSVEHAGAAGVCMLRAWSWRAPSAADADVAAASLHARAAIPGHKRGPGLQ